MKETVFKMVDGGFAYSCCRPGDQSGIYVSQGTVNKFKKSVLDKISLIQHQVDVLAAVQCLEHNDKNFLCNPAKLSIMKRDCLAEIGRLSDNLNRECALC